MSSNTLFPVAGVSIIHPRGRKSKSRRMRVAVSQNIYWKEVSDDGKDDSYTLADFCDANSLEVVRMKNASSWRDVEENVRAEERNNKPCIIVSGALHGPSRRKNLILHNKNVKIAITLDSKKQRDLWLERIRARAAPWKLLQERIKALAVHIQCARLGKVHSERIESPLVNDEMEGYLAVPSAGYGIERGEWTEKLCALTERMKNLDWVDSIGVQSTAATEVGATIVGLVEKAERVAETAEFVADLSKCVSGASTMFHVVVLCARLVSTFAEAKRGCSVLPGALSRALILLRYVLRSLTQIINPTSGAESLHEQFIFNVLEQTVDTLVLIETQLLRGSGSRFLYAKVVKEIEMTMKELEHKVVTVTNISSTSVIREEVANVKERFAQMESDSHHPSDGLHHPRPELSPYFVGRTKQLRRLKIILKKRGSAAITQYGGAGKTELMLAFAVLAEQKGEVPGGTFWVTIDGKLTDVVDSLASLAEKLTMRTMSRKERENPNLVVAELRRGLSKREGRWLLCLDNADNSEVGRILDGVCAIVEPSKENGWVLVTSRQGQPKIWGRMKNDQRLVLQPLSEEDSMVVLWRQIRVIEVKDTSDEIVMDEIYNLKKNDSAEYLALKELCGYEGSYSLGGLPLALVQAGTYIGRFECSFEKYLRLLREADKKEDLDEVLVKSEQLSPITEAQRSILTTWRVSVASLSDKAYGVLRALSMLGPTPIPDIFLTGILEKVSGNNESVEWMFRNVVMNELVHGSSLICRVYRKDQCPVEIHRLVRRFVLTAMERGATAWNKSYVISLLSVHSQIGEVLEKEGTSFKTHPDLFGEHHYLYLEHTIPLVDHFSCSSSSNREILFSLELQEIHWYTGHVLRFFGRHQEAEIVWRRLLIFLRLCYGTDEINQDIATATCYLGRAQMHQGKFDEAEKTFRKSQDMRRVIYGEDTNHPDIADSLNDLGSVYRALGKLNDAETVLTQTLRMRRAIYGKDVIHPELARSLNDLGTVYQDLGRFTDAKTAYEESLEMSRAIYGSDCAHPEIARSLNNLGAVYQDLRKLGDSKVMYEQALKMRRVLYGKDTAHPEVARSLNNLGTVYQDLKLLGDTKTMYVQALEMRKAIYGEGNAHPEVADSLRDLGSVYQDLKKLKEAEALYRKGLDMRKAIYGEVDHPDVAFSLNDLGSVYHDMDRFEDAEKMYRRSLDMKRAIYGEDAAHPEIALSLDNLGAVYRYMGKLNDAEAMYKQSLEMRRAMYGEDAQHPEIALSLDNLGTVYRYMGRLEDAEVMYRKSVEMRRAIYGEDVDHPDVAISLNYLGTLYRFMGKLDDAEMMYCQGLDMRRAVYGENIAHPDVADSLNDLGKVYLDLGKFEDAETTRRQSLKMKRAIYGEDQNRT